MMRTSKKSRTDLSWFVILLLAIIFLHIEKSSATTKEAVRFVKPVNSRLTLGSPTNSKELSQIKLPGKEKSEP